ncbi:unnamed protein product [Cylicostephanus goldi]|uniref:Tudor domain-containing protein n=1 Tax=Cylicostephanus goldi TaxID=71465 RepID=A0A3P6QXC6_CYLGO|nr:unnamed protein product [Cylicostephanus goldi]
MAIAYITYWMGEGEDRHKTKSSGQHLGKKGSGLVFADHLPSTNCTLAVIGLQYGNSPKTWTRVIVEGRPDPTHAKVYLIDYGMRQLVNARSLYEMPIEMMRVPPQAFPIIPKISQPPDLGPGEWQKLKNVRITVHMRGVKDGKFVCDQMTVYDASTRTDVDFGAALRSNIQLEL